MEDLDVAQPAIVFWLHRPGEITRFDRLGDAVSSIMQASVAKSTPVAWVRTADRHIQMEEIRAIAKRSSLSWRLSQVSQAASEIADRIPSKERPKRKKFRWSEPALQET
jgi:hypothetical protein